MPVNPKSLENLVQVKALAAGESTKVIRIRALRPANDWFSSLTAEQRGELVNKLYADSQNASGVTPDKTTKTFEVLLGTPMLLPVTEPEESPVTPDISTLSEVEQRTLRALQRSGFAEYDYDYKKWFAGSGINVSVDPEALRKLAELGFIDLVSGEGLSATYKAKPRPSEKKSKTKKKLPL